MPGEFDPIRALKTLERHQVEFLIVGGFAAWMHGAPVVTTDLDIVYNEDPDNTENLVQALLELKAIYRHQMGRKIQPTASKLRSTQAAGHHLFETQAGDLDALRTVAGLNYQQLLQDTETFDIEGVQIQIATLERVISLKEAAARPKDLIALPVLRAVLQEQKK